MIEPSLLSYIKQNLKDGFSELEIRQILLGAGWGAMDVEEAFSVATIRPKPQSMDILEKELAPQAQSKPGFLGRMRQMVIPSLIVIMAIPIVGITAYWSYSWFSGSGENGTVNSATISSAELEQDATIHDQRRLEDIETIQAALSAFFTANHVYPQTLDELLNGKNLLSIPIDPQTKDNYLYMALGDPALDYSLTFSLETDFGILKRGLQNVNPQNLIKAAEIKTANQLVKGLIVNSPSPELNITDLSQTAVVPGSEITVELSAPTELAQAILISEPLRLTDERSPFRFTFSAPVATGQYEVRVFGFAKNGSILYQTTTFTVKP